MKHLLSIEDLSKDELLDILKEAQKISDDPQQAMLRNQLAGTTLVNLFFENSTRTRVSFEIAAKNLGANVVNIAAQSSSLKKGETILDTVHTLAAMMVDYMVIRHSENGTAQMVVNSFAGMDYNPSIINAGDGIHAHPSQALLDMMTIQRHKKSFDNLSVAVIGDIKHSRVARSQITALQKLGVKDIRIIAPSAFKPEAKLLEQLTYFDNLKQGIEGVDVISLLRVQKERMQAAEIPDLERYFASYGLDQHHLKLAKPDAIVMHPGPINRGVEISPEVADGKQSVILEQVTNSIAVRMAILLHLHAHK